LYGLAISAFNKGVLPVVYVAEPEYKFPGYRFKSYTKTEVDIAAFSTEILLKRANSLGIKINERDFDLELIKTLLKNDKKILLRLIIGVLRDSKLNRRNPHYVPITGYNESTKEFEVIDSQEGFKNVPEALIKNAFDAVRACKRDNRMIVFG